jgi:hypothetical protein
MLKSELEDALAAANAKAAVSQRVEDTIIVDLYEVECAFCEGSYEIQYRVVLGETEFYFCEGCIDDFVKVLEALGYKYNPHSRNKKFIPID